MRRVLTWNDGHQACYEVRDTGKPSTLDHHENIWEAVPIVNREPHLEGAFCFVWTDVADDRPVNQA